LLGAVGAAQQQVSGSASSQTYFLVAAEWANGEETNTLLYNLRPSQGNGLVVEPISQSSTYVILGGFPAMLSAPVIGQPWINRRFAVLRAAVRPTAVGPAWHGDVARRHTDRDDRWTGRSQSAGARPTRSWSRAPVQPVPGLQPVEINQHLAHHDPQRRSRRAADARVA
jgi:hypothetical protein